MKCSGQSGNRSDRRQVNGAPPGGTIAWSLVAADTSTVTASGGSIWDNLWAIDYSTLTIIGSGFNFSYGDYTDGSSLDDQLLTGELADGTAINNLVSISHSGTVTLQAIPEPSCFAVFGIGACGLVLLRRRRTGRQRSAA